MSQAGIISANSVTPVGVVQTLTGNTGGAVAPNGTNNIFLIGASNTNVAGNPVTNTLTITTNYNFAFNYTNVTHAQSPYTVLATDNYISVDCSGGVVQLNFPNAPTAFREWVIKDRTGNASTNKITLTTPGGAVTFDGVTTYTLNSNYEAVNLLANATPTYEIY